MGISPDFQAFSGFELFLLPGKSHTRLLAGNPNSWAATPSSRKTRLLVVVYHEAMEDRGTLCKVDAIFREVGKMHLLSRIIRFIARAWLILALLAICAIVILGSLIILNSIFGDPLNFALIPNQTFAGLGLGLGAMVLVVLVFFLAMWLEKLADWLDRKAFSK